MAAGLDRGVWSGEGWRERGGGGEKEREREMERDSSDGVHGSEND